MNKLQRVGKELNMSKYTVHVIMTQEYYVTLEASNPLDAQVIVLEKLEVETPKELHTDIKTEQVYNA